MSGLAELGTLWNSIQAWLFPALKDELGELDDRHREFVPYGRYAVHASIWRLTAGSATAARPRTAWRCATRTGRPCGTTLPPAP